MKMDPEISHCLVHMILVQNAVQCLLNAAAFLIGPFKWHYLPPFAPIGLLTTTFAIYTISKPRFKLIIWYIMFLLLGFIYRIYVIVDIFMYRGQILQTIKNCDDYDLLDFDTNSECEYRLDLKVVAINLINSVTFHFVALILDVFLIIISIQLRYAWKCLDEHRLLLLTVQYDKNNQVINKYLRDKYGTFRVLAEDGNINDEVDFIKGSLLKANYFDNFSESESFVSSFEKSDKSDFTRSLESNPETSPFKCLQDSRFNGFKIDYVDDSAKNVETNEKVNDEIMKNIVDQFINTSV